MHGNIGQLPGQLAHGVMSGEGIAGGAAHAINPTLGKVYDVGNAIAGAALPLAGGPVAGVGALMPAGGGGGQGGIGGQMFNPQLLRLIQMLSQRGG